MLAPCINYLVWLIKNCVNKDTGRPVAPFIGALEAAVPAISKCAQVYFS